MRGLIVINSFSSSSSINYKAFRLKEEFKAFGVVCDTLKTVDLPIIYKDGEENIKDIDKWDFCVFLDKDKYLIDALEQRMPVFNSAKSTFLCDDKMVTFEALRGSGILTPKTIPAPLCYSPSPDKKAIDFFLDTVERELGYPLIIKESYGSLGKQVYLIHDRAELDKKNNELLGITHLFQQYYPEAYGKDFRIITVGGKYLTSMERINPHDFRSNVYEGGVGHKVNLPSSFKEVAEKASLLLGLDYGGIDILQDKEGKPVFIEANSNCFFSEIEKVTGVNVTRQVVMHILQKLQEKGIFSFGV